MLFLCPHIRIQFKVAISNDRAKEIRNLSIITHLQDNEKETKQQKGEGGIQL